MPSWIHEFFLASNPYFYLVFGLSLFFAGLCMPISADLVLLTAGYFAYRSQLSYSYLIPTAVTSILLADTIMFGVGRHFGRRVLRYWPFNKVLTPERMYWAESRFCKQGYRVVFLARFMPGIRTVFMFTSGMLGLNYKKFILYNFSGAIIFVPLILFSVRWISGNLEYIRLKLVDYQWWAFGFIVLGFIVFYILNKFFFRMKRC